MKNPRPVSSLPTRSRPPASSSSAAASSPVSASSTGGQKRKGEGEEGGGKRVKSGAYEKGKENDNGRVGDGKGFGVKVKGGMEEEGFEVLQEKVLGKEIKAKLTLNHPPTPLNLFRAFSTPPPAADGPNATRVMGAEEFGEVCEAGGVGMGGIQPVLLLWKVGAKEMGVITEEEWMKGMGLMKFPRTPKELAHRLSTLESSLFPPSLSTPASDPYPFPPLPAIPAFVPLPIPRAGYPGETPEEKTAREEKDAEGKKEWEEKVEAREKAAGWGKGLWEFGFGVMVGKGKRVLEMESCMAFMELLLPRFGFPLSQDLITFYKQSTYKALTRDAWAMTYEFAAQMSSREMKEWSEEDAWPAVVDEFVEWMRGRDGMEVEAA